MPPDRQPSQPFATLLDRSQAGDAASAEALMQILYDELHGLASSLLRQERAGHTLQPTALVNEAYLRLVGSAPLEPENREHFFGAAARSMRQILIKHAVAKNALKRGGDARRVTLCDADTPTVSRDVDLLALEEALGRLEQLDPRQCRVVELRFFAGMTVEQCASVLGVSARTVEIDWQMARAWLMLELGA